MPPSATQTLLSPAELSYLHSSLSLTPPIRPDARTPTQFRPLVAEPDILPGTNGSARIRFADGTEAIVGVKAEVEATTGRNQTSVESEAGIVDTEMLDPSQGQADAEAGGMGDKRWVEMTIEIPGYRDDDSLPVYLASMLNEALVATGDLPKMLWINNRFHWKLYIDILLISPPLSYPVPLLSLTTHLALLSTRLPALVSEGDEDPFFNDDWDAALPVYSTKSASIPSFQPPITLLVVSVGSNLLFDPSPEELAVADAILAISVATSLTPDSSGATTGRKRSFNLVSVRTIDPPARLTPPGIPDSVNSVAGEGVGPALTVQKLEALREDAKVGIWNPPRGGMPRGLVARAVQMCMAEDGVAEEVFAGLDQFSG